tara:strand:+ start:112 stop:648 length:537 start_codon:yes stop_codon:yes gene_type:complete
MAILKVSNMGHPVLRRRAADIPPEQIDTPALQLFIDDMIETMLDYQGIGLAAPQVFRSLRLIVLGIPEIESEEDGGIPLTVLINPEWLHLSEEQVEDWEGCLSIPQLRGRVPRAQEVEVRGLDRQGNAVGLQAEDYFARILQHEIDHLDGILYLDRMRNFESLTFQEEYERYWQPEVE